jgi:hypothetical protein
VTVLVCLNAGDCYNNGQVSSSFPHRDMERKDSIGTDL